MLKSYIPGVNTSILPNKRYESIFSGKLVNELHSCIENQPHVIHSTNVKYSMFFKINGTLLKKQINILQVSVRELRNDMILPISEGSFFGVRTVYETFRIG